MNSQIVIKSPTTSNKRRKSVVSPNRPPFSPGVMLSPERHKKPNVGECAGSTAAECAAICCCCPFVVVEFLVLAVYKVPTRICRRIWRTRVLRNKLKNASLINRYAVHDSCRRSAIHGLDDELPDLGCKISLDGSSEEEMWDRFHNTGFGRSLSQRYF